jgi:ABC-type branched-subunit amino acid transport system permease subunit
MSLAVEFYATTLLVYMGVWLLGAWGLNLQFGTAGLLSFAFVVFQAAGAYTAGVLSLGPQTDNYGFQHYIGGYALPFPLPLLGAIAVGALIAVPIGLVALRRLRSDYQAVALLVISIIATNVASNEPHLFNGAAGISLVPHPLFDQLGVDLLTYDWYFVGFVAVLCLISYFVIHRITHSPLGRAMRAMRDNEHAAASLAKNVTSLRLLAFAIGGAIGAASGAVLVMFIGTWAPSAWFYPETFVFLAAIIIGGTNNSLGVLIGVLLVPIGFAESTRFLPDIGHPGLIDALQWIAIGLLFLVFLWFRPQGIVPERKHRYGPDGRLMSVVQELRGRLRPSAAEGRPA